MLGQVPRAPASGCHYLGGGSPEAQDMYLRFDQTARRSPYRVSRILARHQLVTKIQQEIEAKEACDWLRAAGFPQYSQLYEDSQFPINIVAVKNDHDFLEKDLVEPLYRRLNTLNKCASMKLDVNFQRRKGEDSDDEDLCLSHKWTFQRASRRWSRVDDLPTLFPGGDDRDGSAGDIRIKTTPSSESVLTELSEPEVSSVHSGSSGGSEGPLPPDASRDLTQYPPHPKNEKPGKTRAKSLLRRMETLRGKGAPSRHKGPGPGVLSGLQLPNGDLRNSPRPGVSPQGPSHSTKGGSKLEPSSCSSRHGATGLQDQRGRESSKRGGMYLDDLDVLASTLRGSSEWGASEQGPAHAFRSQESLLVHIPKDHKPGTFPKALSIESLAPMDNGYQGAWTGGSVALGAQQDPSTRPPQLVATCSRESRASIYDNVPGNHLYASTGDLLDLDKDVVYPGLDDILQQVNGIKDVVNDWSRDLLPDLQPPDGPGAPGTSLLPSLHPVPLDFEGTSASEGRTTPSDVDRDGASLMEAEAPGVRERRDSGVGASLTRPSRRLRWDSFQLSHQPQPVTESPLISHQTAGQLNLLQRFSLLRLTAIMEKHSLCSKHGWTWSVPKFMKRMKVPDYRDKAVFGVPLIVHVQRTGQPLPHSIQQALRYLRTSCLDQVGLFRKSGVKSRIQALREMNESFPEHVNYEDQSAYDVADMVKQFFRDLPEPLFTSKLSDTFLNIYQYVPKEQQLQAVQAAILLLADENREVLQTLLCFLNDVVNVVAENQMTPMNLAVCLAPSLFHLNLLKKEASPRAIQKKYATGKPDQRDLNESLAAAQGLAHMITKCDQLFEIPAEMVSQSKGSYKEADIYIPTLEDLGRRTEENGATYHTYLEHLIYSLQKEAKDKFKGWVTCPSSDNTELAFKKVGDGHPLKLWKASVEVEAPPCVVLNRVLRERHVWDEDFMQWKVLEALDKHTEVYQYMLTSMAPHPPRDFVVLRTWRTDLPKGTCVLVSLSIQYEEAQLMGGVRAVMMDSQYLIEPCGSGKSRLTHICRVDLRGHSPEWYNKGFGHLCTAEVAKIRNSFQPIIAGGPETKI
ncbi:PREDICTED: stAR-related lipid transfer protein 13 [Elephantulus edwardii]|uniref:stAR-related lipid transfer protein 13 n=1 Tax=Elephantulus edwardii TaxID=28737 RepID=UPI0003F08949|nr:PREDICTED: stAR-related lipid transfer protein 13 [Elephantulus edwardii]